MIQNGQFDKTDQTMETGNVSFSTFPNVARLQNYFPLLVIFVIYINMI